MIVGIARIELEIPGSNSLKDRRQVVKSLVGHLQSKFHISVAEVDDPQVWRRANIGVALVGTDTAFVNRVLDKVVDAVRGDPRVSIIDYEIEML
ncbi:MAG TPA: DUF503 domain-containing protein [Armatimonadota bacterium]|nr:DUF503 domain-containing protein [Armatimonadota bacterium]HOJ23025.1 DUF503 domain-containing protein [Armatimonadota bacterium]HOM82437.1 DUF503 domain-containing protein [Armatimonadota bacterium]HPO72495.1 DUF503 domain-containing protein [Armatimonadota bacterium]HPT97187.1 DUF503 domain-containing protein [Armatimonadota bacterium]